MANFLKSLFENDRAELRRTGRLADRVVALEDEYAALTDEALQAKTTEFRERIANGESLDSLLVEAFATVREAAERVLGLLPYKVQIQGGIVIHGGNIAEMRTGEGKTLTATMPVYLNALAGKGVHVVTVNEYLATRDAEQMGEVYHFLGLTVGLNLNSLNPAQKREAYNCDITYSTNNELGFDYLRDNMVVYKHEMVQRPLNFAVVDEVDSVLIDEARTPLIISGEAGQSTALYTRADLFVKGLDREEDLIIDVQSKTIALTDPGVDKAEEIFQLENLYDIGNTELVHHIDNALRANYIMLHDIDYVVDEGEVKIVDPFTGRIMDGRRYSDGLHQAIEAKENVQIENESKTMATITFQNYFRMYKKLSGMTGTAKTEEEEFREIYNMNVTTIPTNRPNQREDAPDLLYPNLKTKFQAVARDIQERHANGQPVLVGTVAVETSMYLSEILTELKVPHQVLNAKNHFKEAEIVMEAGQRGAVTIATNMAGRGTDIKLGYGVKELGGLAVIGTERHESRRIDNQLRGRAGRQGDPGASQFYLSLEDDLMRRFGSDRVQQIWENLDVDDADGEDLVIRSRFLTKQVESAQKRVEGNNYDTRKTVLEYDEVMKEQRDTIYGQRQEVINAEEPLTPYIQAMIHRTIVRQVDAYAGIEGEKNLEALLDFAQMALFHEDDISLTDLENKNYDQLVDDLYERANEIYLQKLDALYGPEQALEFEKVIILRVVDGAWTDHIDMMDHLRQGVGLRAYAQTNPLTEYQTEGYERFLEMIAAVEYDITRFIMKAQIQQNIEREQVNDPTPRVSGGAQGPVRRTRQG